MAIERRKFFVIICDICNQTFIEPELEYSLLYDSRLEALTDAKQLGRVVAGRIMCERCAHSDAED